MAVTSGAWAIPTATTGISLSPLTGEGGRDATTSLYKRWAGLGEACQGGSACVLALNMARVLRL